MAALGAVDGGAAFLALVVAAVATVLARSVAAGGRLGGSALGAGHEGWCGGEVVWKTERVCFLFPERRPRKLRQPTIMSRQTLLGFTHPSRNLRGNEGRFGSSGGSLVDCL